MRKELTVRGLIIGVIITLVFTAANVYFGLKAGLTFSTSIPAAVISMAILRGFQECDRPGKQHRANGRLGGRHAVVDHFRPARLDHDRLVDRISVLDLVFDLRARRNSRGDVFDSAAARVGHEFRSALPGRRRLRRSAQGREQRRQRHAADIEHGRAGLLAVLWGSIVAAVFAIIVATQLFAGRCGADFSHRQARRSERL